MDKFILYVIQSPHLLVCASGPSDYSPRILPRHRLHTVFCFGFIFSSPLASMRMWYRASVEVGRGKKGESIDDAHKTFGVGKT